jgi:hypothetical protein
MSSFSMANLLSKFRIDYSSLTMVQDITEAPKEETKKLFDDLISKFTSESTNEGKSINNRGCTVQHLYILSIQHY